jgi:hypothetical protein
MRSPEQILRLYRERSGNLSLLHSKMQGIADIYNGRAEVPLPDLERDEKPSIPNLLQQGVDQMAGRIASVTPMVSFSSARPGIRKSDRTAFAAGQTVTGWWQAERLMMKQKVRARRLIAYGMSPVVVRWDYEEHRPYRQVRHPLETLPSPDLEPGQVTPKDCIFVFKRTYGWLKENGYGAQIRSLIGTTREEPARDAVVTLLEYIDADHTVLMGIGYYNNGYEVGSAYGSNALSGVVLENYENLSEDSPVIIPTRLTLDEMTGQFDGMTGMYYQQAKLMALETIAVEKGIFPDTYLVSRPNEIGKFVDGPHDGRTGRVNIIAGGDIRTEQPQPGYLTNPTIDRLERASRVTAGIPAEFGGESQTNIRTGRRGDAILSATIDFPIADAQELFAFALEEENEVGIQLAKRIDKDTKRTIFVGTGNNRKPVTYVPTETFEVEEHVVSYPAVGTDVNSLVIGLGQRVGLGIMSKETAASLDPYIDNPEFEHDAIIAEGLEQALVSGIQQQAAEGAMPPLTLAKVMKLVKSDRMELAEALQKVADDAAEEQAAMQQSQMDPSMMSADQMNAGPTAQALAAGASPIPGASQGQQDLGTLMSTLRKPAMTIQPMRGMARGAV